MILFVSEEQNAFAKQMWDEDDSYTSLKKIATGEKISTKEDLENLLDSLSHLITRDLRAKATGSTYLSEEESAVANVWETIIQDAVYKLEDLGY